MKRRIKDNNGYTLIELIIVIAIMAILAGLAMVTISSINTAKATSAKESFNQELSTLSTKTKAQDKDFAIKLVKDGDGYRIIYGRCEDGTLSTFNAISGVDEVVLSRVTICYDDNVDDNTPATEVSEMIIKFNKSDGSVTTGSGTYTFYKGSNKTNSVGTVTLNKATGSHYTGS